MFVNWKMTTHVECSTTFYTEISNSASINMSPLRSKVKDNPSISSVDQTLSQYAPVL